MSVIAVLENDIDCNDGEIWLIDINKLNRTIESERDYFDLIQCALKDENKTVICINPDLSPCVDAGIRRAQASLPAHVEDVVSIYIQDE